MTRTLLSVGGLYEATARVHRPRSLDELAAVFADARQKGKQLTLVGAGRSFGRQFLPPEGVDAVDTTALPGQTTLNERTADGLWVRAPGGRTFEELWRDVPNHLPRHAPTGDRITIAGALAACSHNTRDFFTRDVRSFRVMTPDGAVVDCRPDAQGLGGALFRGIPGSFGALGAILDVEIFLRRIEPQEHVEITVVEHRPTADRRALDRFEQLYERGEYPLGLGIFFYGAAGETVLLGDRAVSEAPRKRAPTLPLIDDDTRRNVVFQGLANWAPAASQVLQPLFLSEGKRFHASPYAFAYYQRSYERAYETLAGPAWWATALRRLGVDPRLTVCHQTFVVPIACARDFLDFYFGALRATPKAAARLELQDLIRLPHCPWPLHGSHGFPGGCYFFSVSFSVRRNSESFAVVERFLDRVTEGAFQRFGARVLLLKQTHCDPDLLLRMHLHFVEELGRLRERADPARILTSQFLAPLERRAE